MITEKESIINDLFARVKILDRDIILLKNRVVSRADLDKDEYKILLADTKQIDGKLVAIKKELKIV